MSDIEIPMINGQNDNLVEKEVESQAADKHEKFKETSANLVRKAIAAIDNIGKTSNRKSYEYTEEEVETMFNALQEALDDTKHLFKKKKEFNW